MKRAVLALSVLSAMVAGCERRGGATAPATQPSGTDVTDAVTSALRSAGQSAKAGQTAVSVGKFSFVMPPGADSRVDVADNATSGTNHWSVVVTLNKGEPVLLTPEAYDKIATGMTWPQVAQTFGGDLAESRMSDGYTGTLAIAQGLRRIELTFENGKVAAKTHAGLQWGPTTGPATTTTK